MTTPTNWPNPEQPYVPLFPERSGWHLLVASSRPPAGITPYGVPQLLWWSAQKAAWSIIPTGRIEDLARAEEKSSLSYVGPVLTPAQIAEMLAAERERCSNVCKTLITIEEERYGVGLKTSGAEARIRILSEAQKLIRNLGAAS